MRPFMCVPGASPHNQEVASMTGYLHPAYAESFAEFGTPRELRRSGGWILDRQIPGFSFRDAMGCYPLFACQDWSQIDSDLKDVGNDGLVSLSIVTDPFGDYHEAHLQRCFNHVVKPFKEHFIVDLSLPISTFVTSHHRRYARKAIQEQYIEMCETPSRFLNEWTDLYAHLIDRHNIKGIHAFSRSAFRR